MGLDFPQFQNTGNEDISTNPELISKLVQYVENYFITILVLLLFPCYNLLWLFFFGFVHSHATASRTPFVRSPLKLISGWALTHTETNMLEQNVFNITLKSFDDNKVLKKLSIGYANICSGVQDRRQKF